MESKLGYYQAQMKGAMEEKERFTYHMKGTLNAQDCKRDLQYLHLCVDM